MLSVLAMTEVFFLVSIILFVQSSASVGSTINSEIVLSEVEKKQLFIADEIYAGIVPAVNECWKGILSAIQTGEIKKPEYEQQSFWNDILLKTLKPFHNQIRDVDAVVFDHRPSIELDPIVNVSNVEDAYKLSYQSHHNSEVEWIEVVKDGWIKVSSMIEQLHHKYNWVFDHLFVEGFSDHAQDDVGDILNGTFRQYFNWFKIDDRGLNILPETSSTRELTENSKSTVKGNGTEDKNLFEGLRVLLKLRVKMLTDSARNISNSANPPPCSSSEEPLAGVRGRIFRYIPVFVLLHLLNAEFKYYIMQNVADMYNCIHFQSCPAGPTKELEDHLKTYYTVYFDGIVEVFKEKLGTEAPTTAPLDAWRWRCDPPIIENGSAVPYRGHKEDFTYTRFYDYQTLFVAEETDISLTQTCRETCDMFDGAYSSIPCEEDDWACLEQEKYFDCFDRTKQGLPCPAKARTLCPNGGIKCTSSGKIQTVQFCDGQSDTRYLDWFNYNGTQMGKPTPCAPASLHSLSSKVILERSGLTNNEPQNCEICLCKCAEPLGNDTHRYISLLPQKANISNNCTLVGLKFVKINKVIYIKIAEAQVVNGVPDSSTIKWIEPKLVTNMSDPSQVFRLGRFSKNILLDDFLVPAAYAITGVQFQAVRIPASGDYELETSKYEDVIFPVFIDTDVNHEWNFKYEEAELGLRIFQTEISHFDQPNLNASQWKSNFGNSSAERTKISPEDPDLPTLSLEPSMPSSVSNQYIVVAPTSVKKDAGQTPIPFFDTQDVIEPNNSSFIRGLGIFHKGRPGFGGFLGFRIISTPLTDSAPSPRYNLWRTLKRNSTFN